MKKNFNNYLLEMEEIQNNENEIHYEFVDFFFGIAFAGIGLIFLSFILILIYAYFHDRRNKKESNLIRDIINLTSADPKFEKIWEKIKEKIKEKIDGPKNMEIRYGTTLKDYSDVINIIRRDQELLKEIKTCYKNEVFKEKWKKIIDKNKDWIKIRLKTIFPKKIISLLFTEQ